MSDIVHVTDYVDSGLALLPQQYRGKPRIEAWLSAYLEVFQDIEDVAWDLYSKRQIQAGTATGDLLAKLGAIVNQASEGVGDSAYLNLIFARIASRKSKGRRADLINVTQRLYGPSAAVEVNVFELAPASVTIYGRAAAPTATFAFPYIMGPQFILPAVAAGVEGSFVFQRTSSDTTLTLGSVHSASYSAGPPPADATIASGQYCGSVHHAGFAAGPQPTNAGGGNLAGVVSGAGGAV